LIFSWPSAPSTRKKNSSGTSGELTLARWRVNMTAPRKVNSSIWKKMERQERKVDRALQKLGHSDPSPTSWTCDPELLKELGDITDARNGNDWARKNVPNVKR
jgi:hypothetical protein